MKKGIIVITLITLVGIGLSTANAFAWNNNCGGPGGYGARGGSGNYNANVTPTDYKKFLNETAQIRKAIATDRAELQALMAGQNPDPEKARELTARLVDNEEALNEIAQSSNFNRPVGTGYGQLGNCGGPGTGAANGLNGCNGSGGRRYGRY